VEQEQLLHNCDMQKMFSRCTLYSKLLFGLDCLQTPVPQIFLLSDEDVASPAASLK
jgi:hypothetical protein